MLGDMGLHATAEEDLILRRKTNQLTVPDESSKKYKGIFFGCILLCRDKRSKEKGEISFIWKPAEVTAIDGEVAVQLHYVGSPLKYDRWLSLQSDWKDLAPTKLLSKEQIESGDPLDTEQTTAVYDYLLTGEVLGELPETDPSDSSQPISTITVKAPKSKKSQFNEMIQKMATIHLRASGGPSGSELYVGKKVEVRDIFQTKENDELREKWRLAQVVEIRHEIVRIHFSGWDVKWDEDINLINERDRIRERKRKTQSLDMSTALRGMHLDDPKEMQSTRSCPRCTDGGVSHSHAQHAAADHIPVTVAMGLMDDPPVTARPIVTAPPVMQTVPALEADLRLETPLVMAAPLPVLVATPDLPLTAFATRRNSISLRTATSLDSAHPDNNTRTGDVPTLNSFSLDDSPDAQYINELIALGAGLTVDDRILIAVKVADRRLSSIRSTQNLFDLGDLPASRRGSVVGPAARRNSMGGPPITSRRGSFLGGGGPAISRSLINVSSRNSYPPPDDYRTSTDALSYN